MDSTIVSKVCARCKTEKPLDDFPNCKKNKDGKYSYCKKCNTALAGAWEKSERGKEICRQRRKTESYRARARRRRRKYWDNNPNKYRANYLVNNAVRDGRLPHPTSLPCSDCGTIAEEYHHESYEEDKLLDVMPLCRTCHLIRHGKLTNAP